MPSVETVALIGDNVIVRCGLQPKGAPYYNRAVTGNCPISSGGGSQAASTLITKAWPGPVTGYKSSLPRKCMRAGVRPGLQILRVYLWWTGRFDSDTLPPI